jgi:hypothetical protein
MEYRVKGEGSFTTYVEILEEFDDSYRLVMKRVTESSVREKTEMMSKHLFELCVRTGFLTAVKAERRHRQIA